MRKIDQLRKKYVGKFLEHRKPGNPLSIYHIEKITYDQRHKIYCFECKSMVFYQSYKLCISGFTINLETSSLSIDHSIKNLKMKICSKEWVRTMSDMGREFIDEFNECE